MDTTPLPAPRRKRDAPHPVESSDEESVPAKQFIPTPSTAATGETSNDPSSSASDTAPDQRTPQENNTLSEPSGQGLTHFLNALARQGTHRQAFMKAAPAAFFYKCQGYYCYHQHGDHTKQRGRQLKVSKATQQQWQGLTGTVQADAFAKLLEFFQVAQAEFKLFLNA